MTHHDTLQQPILVLGGGLVRDKVDGRIGLTERTYHRLWASLPTALNLAQGAFVLCSGGYSRMDNVDGVNRGQEEGYQMADWFMFQGVPSRQLEVDPTPESTIGNLVGAAQGGWVDLDNWRPLTVVTHTWHLPRVEAVGRELGINGLNHIDAGIQGASSYEPISREAHVKVLGGVGRSALMSDPRYYEAAIGRYIEGQINQSA